MTKRHARTTTRIARNEDGYFAFHLDNGGIRIGLESTTAKDYPAGHRAIPLLAAATPETVEDLFDAAISCEL